MKKINTILAALSALLMLTVTSANSVEFKAGVSANGMAAYANASETLKDSGAVSNQEAILATSYASIFAEVSGDEMMGLGIGISYAPDVVEMDKETRIIQESATGDSGTQSMDAKVNDLVTVYMTLPVGDSGAYFKAGYMQATMVTNESLATGSKYEDVDLTGTTIGGGFEQALGDNAFWRAEGSYQMWEDMDAKGSEVGGTAGSKNTIEAEVGSVTGSLSIGMRF